MPWNRSTQTPIFCNLQKNKTEIQNVYTLISKATTLALINNNYLIYVKNILGFNQKRFLFIKTTTFELF